MRIERSYRRMYNLWINCIEHGKYTLMLKSIKLCIWVTKIHNMNIIQIVMIDPVTLESTECEKDLESM